MGEDVEIEKERRGEEKRTPRGCWLLVQGKTGMVWSRADNGVIS
jgi:hypothetical protein